MKSLLPIVRHNINLGPREIASIFAGALSGRAAEGDELRRFEDEFAAFHGVRYAVAFSSGRAAMYVLFKAMDVPAGSDVMVPAYNFYTIPDVIRACGLNPVFAPCHPRNYAIDPETMESIVKPGLKAVVVIHPFGQSAPMDEIIEIANRRGIAVVEDPSQSIGARYRGRRVGSFGRGAAFSLVHGKNITSFGGGMLVTDDAAIYGRALKVQASAPPPSSREAARTALSGIAQWLMTTKAGYLLGLFAPFYFLSAADRKKFDAMFEEERSPFSPDRVLPLSNIQAAVGRRQLARLDELNAVRRMNAALLLEGLAGADGLGLPESIAEGEGTWNSFPVRVFSAPGFQRRMMLSGIDTRRDYMDVSAFAAEWSRHGDVVYLPNHPGLDGEDMNRVAAAARRAALKVRVKA